VDSCLSDLTQQLDGLLVGGRAADVSGSPAGMPDVAATAAWAKTAKQRLVR
jgi:hypothetical protein